MSVERTRALLGGRRDGIGNVAAAGLGVVTPFCSCSAVPVFIGFVAAGVPLGVTMSFLIASPMVNEVAIVLLFGLFGWKITALYIALRARRSPSSPGASLGRLGLERWVEPFVFETKLRGKADRPLHGPVLGRPPHHGPRGGRHDPPQGLALPARRHRHSARPSTAGHPRTGSPPMPAARSGVPIAVGLGVPLYSNAAGVLPLVEALHDKGMPMGTVLAFMMSVVALSLPEMILLRRVLKPQLIATYVAIVASGILATGYLFNLVL